MTGVTALLTALKSGTAGLKHLGLDVSTHTHTHTHTHTEDPLVLSQGITVTLEIASIIHDMEQDIGIKIPHSGTGGYRKPKPILTPLQKLTKYTAQNSVKLRDLFLVYDKERLGYLKEEDFRAALKVRCLKFQLSLKL